MGVNMIAFLTSSPGGQYMIDSKRVACGLDESNDFVKKLAKYWKTNADVLLVSSDPYKYEINDSIKNIFEQSFPMSSLSISKIDVWDYRMNEMPLKRFLEYDVIILSGGHVPTQNAFFTEITLSEMISQFTGIIIGISAGTMNCASTVYAQPEVDGEAVSSDYQRFLKGLGLTDLMILPHYQDVKFDKVDGLRAIEDIAFVDSVGKEFLCICDGSYVMIDDVRTTLFGEGYLIADGKIRKVCEQDQHILLA